MLSNRVNRAPASRSARAATLVGVIAVTAVIGGFGASAQSFATMSGSVLDPNKAAIAGVTVSLTNARSRARYEVQSDASGHFEFVGLLPGEYQIQATQPGFVTFTRNITVTPKNLRQDISMAIGALRETVSIASAPGTRSAAPRQPQSHQPIAVSAVVADCRPSGGGGDIRAPRKVRNVSPVYPDNPDGTLQGTVVLEGRVATDGTITQAKVLRSPHPELERAALDAFEQWAFTPTLLDCVPIEVSITATMDFTAR